MAPFRRRPIAPGGLPRTAELSERILCLPMANDLTEVELEAIASVLAAEHAPPGVGEEAASGLPV
jgi:dTDP-4-amino-4,6-dideoxygalactose transaminase